MGNFVSSDGITLEEATEFSIQFSTFNALQWYLFILFFSPDSLNLPVTCPFLLTK